MCVITFAKELLKINIHNLTTLVCGVVNIWSSYLLFLQKSRSSNKLTDFNNLSSPQVGSGLPCGGYEISAAYTEQKLRDRKWHEFYRFATLFNLKFGIKPA